MRRAGQIQCAESAQRLPPRAERQVNKPFAHFGRKANVFRRSFIGRPDFKLGAKKLWPGQRKSHEETMRLGAFGGVELVKRGVTRFDLRDPYHLAIELSWRGFALVFIGAAISLNVIFALLYLASPGCIANARPGYFPDAFFFSIETLATVGYGVMAPATAYGHVISAIEILTGTAFTAIMTGLLFVRFSKPRPKILFAEKAVIALHNGAPTLMLRIANGRMTLLTDASARLGVLLQERSAEGQRFRRVQDLTLSSESIPLFPLTWTLVHVIDAESPLRGYDAERLEREEAQLFLTVEARDYVLGAFVYDIRIYNHAHVFYGARYAEAITIDDGGRYVADLSRLSVIEPDPAPET